MLLGGLAAAALMAPGGAHADMCVGQGDSITAANIDQSERSSLCLLNNYRVDNGLAPLPEDASLHSAARAYSEDMANRNYFNHFGGPGCDTVFIPGNCSTPTDRGQAAGYPGGVGENIAYDSLGSPASFFDLWRNSPGHNANMLDPDYKAVGIGLAPGLPQGSGTGGATATQDFGTTATGGTYIGLDMLVTDACVAAEAAADPLAQTVADLQAKIKKAKRKHNRKKVKKLKQKLKDAEAQLADAQAKVDAECHPTHF